MTSTQSKSRARTARKPAPAARRAQRSRTALIVAGVVVLALVGLFAVYQTSSKPGATASDRYDVGSPGVGAPAPDFSLPDVSGPAGAADAPAAVQLSDYRGKTVLLYFHEGLGCQPCWDQIRDLESNPSVLAGLGVDQLLTITSGPLDLIAQKMSDDGLSAPALVDADLRVSTEYQANRYGMMGTSRAGHSFILVGPDGVIQWRADYGGPPNFTMYVPVDQLADDLRAGRKMT